MPIKHLAVLIALLQAMLFAGPTAAQTTSNVQREKNWADQVVDTVVVGEPVWLRARQHQFLALYAAPAKPNNRGVILIHGRGVHPAWGFIDNLRTDITEAGFQTLSLQMPILEAEAPFGAYGKTFPEAYERIDAGIRYLKGKGAKQILLLGHSTGAMVAVAYAARKTSEPVSGIVAIGLSTYPNGPDSMQPAIMLKSVYIPVLDLFGSKDLPEVLNYTTQRRAAAQQAGNKNYLAVRVAEANHFFTDQYPALKTKVLDWLKNGPAR